MTRRGFIQTAAAAVTIRPAPPARLSVPIHRVMDARAQCPPDRLHYFWSTVWPEAVRDFHRGGIELQTTDSSGEIRRSPGDQPILVGLQYGAINLVLTDHIPMKWDTGRALAGVTTIYDGYHLCMLALRYVHGNQVPFLSVNTCVHELLHALLEDIYVSHPTLLQSGGREFRADEYATCMWLFHDGTAVRKSAQAYLDRLRADAAARPAI